MTGKRNVTVGEIMDLEDAAQNGDASAERQLNAAAKANGYLDYTEMMSEWSGKMRTLAGLMKANLRAEGYGEILGELAKLRGSRLSWALRDLSFDDLKTAYANALPKQPSKKASLRWWFDYFYQRKSIEPGYRLEDLAADCGRAYQTVRNYNHETYKPSHPEKKTVQRRG